MHQDIEKLLNAAKEKGSITEKQREIILNKAQQLGEDMAEVEFVLEDIPLKKDIARSKTKKCPYCGALIDDMALKCPDCGRVLHDESDATQKVRDLIQEINVKMKSIKKGEIRKELVDSGVKDNFWLDDAVDRECIKRKCEVIASFSVPVTTNALIQGYEYAYGQYSALKEEVGIEEDLAKAWLGKATEFYGIMQSVQNPDAETMAWLQTHSNIKKAKTGVIDAGFDSPKDWIKWLISVIFCIGLFYGIYKLIHG